MDSRALVGAMERGGARCGSEAIKRRRDPSPPSHPLLASWEVRRDGGWGIARTAVALPCSLVSTPLTGGSRPVVGSVARGRGEMRRFPPLPFSSPVLKFHVFSTSRFSFPNINWGKTD